MAAKILGHNISDITIFTVRPAEAIKRKQTTKQIKVSAFNDPPDYVVIWNSKSSLKAAIRNVGTLEDWVAILVTGKHFGIVAWNACYPGCNWQRNRLNCHSWVESISIYVTVSLVARSTWLRQIQGRIMVSGEWETDWVEFNLNSLPPWHQQPELFQHYFRAIRCTRYLNNIFEKLQKHCISVDNKTYRTMVNEENPIGICLENERIKKVDLRLSNFLIR